MHEICGVLHVWFTQNASHQHSERVCTFPVLNMSVWVCVQLSPASNIERDDTLWSRTWIAHWFLGASLTIHSNWFLALLGVRVMAVLMYHLYVYSSPLATGFTIVCGKCMYNTIWKFEPGTFLFCALTIIHFMKCNPKNLPSLAMGKKKILFLALNYCFYTPGFFAFLKVIYLFATSLFILIYWRKIKRGCGRTQL